MQEYGQKNPSAKLADLGLNVSIAHWNISPEELVKKTLELGQGQLNDAGALCVSTGKFTGRSPKDKFTVKDAKTENSVDWGDVNFAMSSENFDALYSEVCKYLDSKEVWVRDAYACADPKYRLNIRVINESPWSTCFATTFFCAPMRKK